MNQPPSPAARAAGVLETLRRRRPLVLSLTNSVVQPLTANLLLAVGAVPAMLSDGQEAGEMIRACANALLINTGTLTAAQADAMRQAVAAARDSGVPWVLDPVAAGLLSVRTALCRELLATPPALIRGNASEIIALAGGDAAGRGPESNDEALAALPSAQDLARRTGAAVLVTGAVDYATDGATTWAIHGGHPLMTRVTGVGCAMGALAAACVASAASPLDAAVATAVLLGLAGERAAARAPRPGSFAVALLDELDILRPEDIRERVRVESV